MEITKKLKIYTAKFQYHPPWSLTHFGFGAEIFTEEADEWGNKSTCITVPLIGMFVWFPGEVDRSTWYLSGMSNGQLWYVSPGHKQIAVIVSPDDTDGDPFDYAMEHEQTLTDEEIFTRSIRIDPF